MRFCLPLLLACALPVSLQAQSTLVVHNARVYTVDSEHPQAQGFAVQDGRFVQVGSDAELLAAFPDAEHVDAEGRTIVPGLIDAHAHLMGLGTSLLQADLVGASSKSEILERLRAFERRLPEGAWIVGRGWDQNLWPEKVFPTRQDLDEAFPSRPVWLVRIDGHVAWSNTAAINQTVGMEVLRALQDPEGGKIEREVTGLPTGVFIDTAMGFVGGKVPAPSAQDYDRGLTLALEETARFGLTGVHEAGIDARIVQLYDARIAAGSFPIRVYGWIGGRGSTFDYYCENGPLDGHADRLSVRAVKFYMDGALGSRGAALLAPYSDDPGNVGLLTMEPEVFLGHVRRALECGFQINTHAIGDRANRVVLDAYEAAGAEPSMRLRVEHAQILAPEDIPRFASLGVIASMQPTHATSDMPWAGDRVGPERVAGAYAWRSLLDAGARLALGSDFPVERVNPLLGFYAAITRQDAAGQPEDGWLPQERLTREEALRGFTLDAAYAAFMEDEVGSIEPGKHADFVILSRNIMEVPPAEILQTEVVATYLSGEPIYARE